MRLLALLGLISLALANPIPDDQNPYNGVCRAIVDNKALTLSCLQADNFFNAVYPAYEALCGSMGVKMNRRVARAIMGKCDRPLSQRKVDELSYEVCTRERLSNVEVIRQCKSNGVDKE